MKIQTLLKGSLAISFGTVLAGGLSYLFSAFMGRHLGPVKFGDLGAISSFLVITTSVSTALSTISMHYSGHFLANNQAGKLRHLYHRLTAITFLASFALMLVAYLLTPFIVKTFSISDSRALYIATVTIITTFILAINKGILQGAQKFWVVALVNIIEISAKLIVGVALVMSGFSLIGAAIALIASSLASYCATLYFLRGVLSGASSSSDQVAEDSLNKKDFINYLIPTVISTVLLLILMNADTILVKYYFSPEQAGKYIAVATIAKIIFFITGPISLVMFPLITEQRAKGEKHYQTLGLSLGLTILGSLAILAIYYLFSTKIISLLYGNVYSGLGGLLPLVSVFVIFTSLVNLMTQYFMSVRKFFFSYLIVFCLVILGLLSFAKHGTLQMLVLQFVYVNSLLFILMMIYYLVMKRSQIAKKLQLIINGTS